MKIGVDIGEASAFERALLTEIDRGERAVTRAMRRAGRELQKGWRTQIRGAGLGNRLPRTIRLRVYPAGDPSLNAAAMVYSNAPHIVGPHSEGETIRSPNGFYLVVPTPAATQLFGRVRRSRLGHRGRFNPIREVERRLGQPLRPIHRQGRPSLLVLDNVQVGKTGRVRGGTRISRAKGGGRYTQLKGRSTVVMFVLVPQVRLRKRLDLDRETDRIGAGLPEDIVAAWGGG
jgi:hypothetical protein